MRLSTSARLASAKGAKVKAETLQRMNEIFRDVFDDQNIQLSGETSAKDIDAWDSLNHINLIINMEQVFKIHFDINELASLKNVGEMADLIERKSGT